MDLRELAGNLEVSPVCKVNESDPCPSDSHHQWETLHVIFLGIRAPRVLHQAFFLHLGISAQSPLNPLFAFIQDVVVCGQEDIHPARSHIVLIAIRSGETGIA